ncbi:hypothetical protein C0991_001410 [Blastosporella zonata]|nr:hypothetical protein C0991_001410 [Blastosporella zonata]
MRAKITARQDKKPNATGSAVVLTTTVAAILDPLDNDNDDETVFHTSDEDINMFPDKYVIPKPLHWIGSVNTPNGQFHVIQMLIDHGLSPALISESLATQLLLERIPLKKPLSVVGTFHSSSNHASIPQQITHYVTLSVSSRCN